MARRSSSKVAHSNELRSRQHRGYEYDLEARNDDRRDSDLMKRCTGIKNESRSTAGKLYRTIEDEPSNDLVKTWLANTGNLQSSVTISPTNIANSPKIHHRKSRQGYGDDVSIKTPYMNQDAWRSSQRSHKKGALLPLTGHTLHYHGRRCRKHPISDNSSLLSIAEDRREHAADPYPVRQNACINDDTPPRCTEGKVDTSDDKAYSRSSSPAAESSRFEKKKRYKTKDDRYDTKKQDRIVLDPGPQPHKSKKRKQDDKKKSLMSSKSVMKNFDPQAVLRDRITASLP